MMRNNLRYIGCYCPIMMQQVACSRVKPYISIYKLQHYQYNYLGWGGMAWGKVGHGAFEGRGILRSVLVTRKKKDIY